MKFREVNPKDFTAKIKVLNPKSYWMNGSNIFYVIDPGQSKKMALKTAYKPDTLPGPYTNMHTEVTSNHEVMELVMQKIQDNHLNGAPYKNADASLKLHLSLNNIGEIEESVLLGLIELLIEQAKSENNMAFHFKVISSAMHNDSRFKDTDQITIYFDKYSSAADIVHLSNEIENYLINSKVPYNQKLLGDKDKFSLNSFVSARFDTNKMTSEYTVFSFFDLELQKFFNAYRNDNALRTVPLCAFEAVFNRLIASPDIRDLKSDENGGLTPQDSTKVQNEFRSMLANPEEYIRETATRVGKEFGDGNISDGNQSDGNQSFDEDAVPFTVTEEEDVKQAAIYSYQRQSSQDQDDEQEEIEENQTEVKGPRLLNKKAELQFEEFMTNLDNKAKRLKGRGDEEKSKLVAGLHTTLSTEFNFYKYSESDEATFDNFSTKCNSAIKDAESVLGHHRGWKQVFINALLIISSLGSAPFINLAATKGKHFFFKVNTDSINKLSELQDLFPELADEEKMIPQDF